MKKFKYQQKYISKLVEASEEYLLEDYYSTIIFQAPTGSGKTYMLSEAMTRIVKKFEGKKEFSFIWVSVNRLHEQSKSNLERYFQDERLLECIEIYDIQNNQLQDKEVLFINWDKLIKKDNLFMRDNERDYNLTSVVENTKEDFKEIILIIDESHRTAHASKAKEVRELISPKLTIEVTATPKDIPSDRHIKVRLSEVIEAGMIKSEIQINPEVTKAKTNKDLLKIALKKRAALKKYYEDLGSDIHPLLLIQVPNRKVTDVEPPEDYMISLLHELGLTTENGKLAIKLSEKDKQVNLELIEKHNNEVEALIFKESIAVGWDCPRAAILFLQREWNIERYEFNIQTLGRIMRMPEQKHYDEKPELNIGYVYSASNNFFIVDELAKDYATSVFMNRDNEKYVNLSLISEFIRRKREVTRLSREFKKCLLDAADELQIKDKIIIGKVQFKKDVGSNGTVLNIDEEQSIQFSNSVSIIKDRIEVEKAYYDFCGMMSAPFAKARSSQIIKSSIRTLFKKYWGEENEDVIGQYVLNSQNNPVFQEIILKAKELYRQLPVRKDKVILSEKWQIPKTINIHSDNEIQADIAKSIMQPFYLKKNINGKIDLSDPECKFIKLLEKTDNDVLFWYKNGDRESRFLGIAYKKDQGFYGFYPDYLIKTKQETIIVEIKSDKDFKHDNLLKLNAGRDYLKRYADKFIEPVRFYIISPNDFSLFFQKLKDLTLSKFSSSYENNLLRYSKSNQVIIKSKIDKSDKDAELLEVYEELDKTLNELDDTQLRNELLQIELGQAKENIKTLSIYVPKIDDEKIISIIKPFNIVIIGKTIQENTIRLELQRYFEKYGLLVTDWSVDFINNQKLYSTNIFRTLRTGQSKYNLIITGQIFHHSSKENKSANILTELKNEKYIPHIVGCNPKNLLSVKNIIASLQKYFAE